MEQLPRCSRVGNFYKISALKQLTSTHCRPVCLDSHLNLAYPSPLQLRVHGMQSHLPFWCPPAGAAGGAAAARQVRAGGGPGGASQDADDRHLGQSATIHPGSLRACGPPTDLPCSDGPASCGRGAGKAGSSGAAAVPGKGF
jgi:hypothetical protein